MLWIWNDDDNKWVQSSGLSEDVITYVDGSISTSNTYPVDYVAPSQTIHVKQYENYEVHNPLIID